LYFFKALSMFSPSLIGMINICYNLHLNLGWQR